MSDGEARRDDLAWQARAWRGPLAYVRERPLMLAAAALILLRAAARLALLRLQTGSVSGALAALPGRYDALDVATALFAGWTAFEVVTLRWVRHEVSAGGRVGTSFLGGAYWRDGPGAPVVSEGRRVVTFDWGRGPGHMRIFGVDLEAPVERRLRFRLDRDEAEALREVLDRHPQER